MTEKQNTINEGSKNSRPIQLSADYHKIASSVGQNPQPKSDNGGKAGVINNAKGLKQIIIARKDLHMSYGKLSAQVSHGSMAFLTTDIRKHTQKIYDADCKSDYFPAWTHEGNCAIPQYYRRNDLNELAKKARKEGKKGFYAKMNQTGEFIVCEPEPDYHYQVFMQIENDLFEYWINDAFTKVVLQARNKNHLLKAISMATEMDMTIGHDVFPIYDNCRTELQPEEDNGTTLTVVGFRPMREEVIDQIGRKYHLYV